MPSMTLCCGSILVASLAQCGAIFKASGGFTEGHPPHLWGMDARIRVSFQDTLALLPEGPTGFALRDLPRWGKSWGFINTVQCI